MRELKRAERPIQIANQSKRLRLSAKEVEGLFSFLDEQPESRVPLGTLSIAFLEDEEHTRVHREYMNNCGSTDVITFPGDPEMGLSGEICVSVDCAEQSAQARSEPLREEITLYLLHGWLHLAGFDDREQASAKKMRLVQCAILSRIRAAGLVPDFRLLKDDK